MATPNASSAWNEPECVPITRVDFIRLAMGSGMTEARVSVTEDILRYWIVGESLRRSRVDSMYRMWYLATSGKQQMMYAHERSLEPRPTFGVTCP